ncbi:MAG: YciI family protein [Methanoregula sp.]
MSHRLDFISLLRLKRPDFLTTMTPEEQAVMGEHIEYIRNLSAQGNIAMSGAAIDGTVGVVIYRVDSAVEARRLFYNDPAVIAGIGYPELHPFRIGHLTAS